MTGSCRTRPSTCIDEAASKMRLSVYVEPKGVKKLEEDIRKLEKAKEDAIRSARPTRSPER